MADAAELVTVLKARDEASKTLESFGARIEKVGKQIGDMGKKFMLAGGIITGAIMGATMKFAAAADALEEMSMRTGISTQKLQELAFIARRAGGDLGTVENLVRRMQMSLVQGGKAFEQLGLSIAELLAMNPEQQFTAVATAIASIEDPTQRAGLAMAIFGREGTALLPMFEGGVAGMAALTQKAHELGFVMGDEAVKKGAALADSLDELKMAFEGLGNAIGASTSFKDLIEQLTGVIAKVTEWAKANPELVTTILKVGVALIGAGGLLFAISKIIAIVRAMAAAFAVAQAFMGPGGWATLAVGAAAAIAAIALINRLTAGTPETTGFIFKHPESPGYQRGGIVTKPTLAMIGEAGPEAVVPLSSGMGNTYVTVNVEGSVTSERDLLTMIREEFIKLKTRNTSTGFA